MSNRTNTGIATETGRRSFLAAMAAGSAAIFTGQAIPATFANPLSPLAPPQAKKPLRLGLVTYQWGKDMPLPELLQVCERTKYAGVELRSTHKHGVEPSLSRQQRDEVKKRFADSPVALVGLEIGRAHV